MLGQRGRQSENPTFDLAIKSQPDLPPPPAHIANFAAPKVITSFMALISSGHCSHHRLNESGIMGNIKVLGVVKGNLF
ncbi:hypothetical protein I5L29_01950 [Serratia marcescens]|nr:hypothetical protein [Serratia marcescens]